MEKKTCRPGLQRRWVVGVKQWEFDALNLYLLFTYGLDPESDYDANILFPFGGTLAFHPRKCQSGTSSLGLLVGC